MKQLAIVLAATVIFLTIGCEKRAGQAEEADRYKADIDGPTCVLIVRADENLLADQKILSSQAKLSEASAERENKTTDEEDAGREETTPVPADVPAPAPADVPEHAPADVPEPAPADVPEHAPETGGERES